jgi:hypothetical protein
VDASSLEEPSQCEDGPPPGNHPGEVSAGPGAPTFPKNQPTTATKKIGDARTKVNGRKRWIRVVCRCWQSRTPYDEATCLTALKQRGSSLLN